MNTVSIIILAAIFFVVLELTWRYVKYRRAQEQLREYPPVSASDRAQLNAAVRALQAVLDERGRQQFKGWTMEHDDTHEDMQLAMAGAVYALAESQDVDDVIVRFWPWGKDSFKPKTREENLIRAAALIIAELERIYRKKETQKCSDHSSQAPSAS